ncbi:MAG: hypothetical protein MJA29_14260 [Candidatus Omnitrophica bacterium]|nr:hypothetical protein [Candidatus Omnitrophota bacterium]
MLLRSKFSVLYSVKGILAFCSIVYELLLAQTLSAFLANTVLRYSVTIGLYLFSLGLGAWCAERRWYKESGIALLITLELLLTAVGGFSVTGLYLAGGSAWFSPAVFSLTAHSLIILIGFMTGMELPLLMDLRAREEPGSEEVMLAWDYAGAVAGTVVFALVFYSRLGLVTGALCAGFLNALAGMLLISRCRRVEGRRPVFLKAAFGLQIALCVLLAGAFYYGQEINRYLMLRYVS